MASIITPESMFSASEMTEAVNKLPSISTFLSPYFTHEPIRTTDATFDVSEHQVKLVSTSERGTMPRSRSVNKKNAITIPTAHLALEDFIKPEDIQDVRSFGTTEPITAAEVINNKMQKLKDDLIMTLEYHRLGAIQGKVLDADGNTVIYDLHKTFGKTKNSATISLSSKDDDFACIKDINAVVRKVELGMGGTPFTRIEAIVGSDFYDALTTAPGVAKYFYDWLARRDNFGENDYRHKGFTLGKITFYESTHIVGGQTLVNAKKAHIYPVGPKINTIFDAPADWMSTANSYGLPFYARMDQLERDRGYVVEVQANPATICTYPEALFELTLQESSLSSSSESGSESSEESGA